MAIHRSREALLSGEIEYPDPGDDHPLVRWPSGNLAEDAGNFQAAQPRRLPPGTTRVPRSAAEERFTQAVEMV